jgi:Mg-chelatase subunit ChlD
LVNKLLIKQDINRPNVYNQSEKEIILRLDVQPSDELRQDAYQNRNKKIGTDVCIVLDASGSMGEPLRGEMKSTGRQEYIDGKLYDIAEFVDETGITKRKSAVQAVKKLIPLLREEDTISLVAYDDNPYLMFEGLKRKDEAEIVDGLKRSMKYGGNTNVSAALREAKNVLRKLPENRYKRIIFLTDGHPTSESEEAGIQEGQLLAEYNITIDCLGIGKDYNYDYLQKIAIPSRGITRQINTPEEAEALYRELFQVSQNLIATNVELKLQFSPDVRASEYYRGLPENTFLGKIEYDSPTARLKTFKLGDINRDKKQRYFFKMTVPAEPGFEGVKAVARAELSYDLPGLSAQREVTNAQIAVQYVERPNLALNVNSDVENGFKLVEIARLVAEADELQKDPAKKVLVLTRYKEIAAKYTELKMEEEAEMYRNIADKFERDEKISKHEMNTARGKTSTAGNETDALPPFIDQKKIAATFGNFGKFNI